MQGPFPSKMSIWRRGQRGPIAALTPAPKQLCTVTRDNAHETEMQGATLGVWIAYQKAFLPAWQAAQPARALGAGHLRDDKKMSKDKAHIC